MIIARPTFLGLKQVIRISGMYSNCRDKSLSMAFFKIWFLKKKEIKMEFIQDFVYTYRIRNPGFTLFWSAQFQKSFNFIFSSLSSLKPVVLPAGALTNGVPCNQFLLFMLSFRKMKRKRNLSKLLLYDLIPRMHIITISMQTLISRLAAAGFSYFANIESKTCKEIRINHVTKKALPFAFLSVCFWQRFE